MRAAERVDDETTSGAHISTRIAFALVRAGLQMITTMPATTDLPPRAGRRFDSCRGNLFRSLPDSCRGVVSLDLGKRSAARN